MILSNFIRFPYYYIKLSIMAKSEKYTEKQRYDYLRKICYRANKGGKVDVEAYGLENIPKENGYIMFPNHQGLYDVLTLIATHEKPFSVVMKKELANIPMLKKVFLAMRAHAIDRDDIRQSMQVIKKVSEEVLQGRNFVIFPEGTRSKNGNTVGEFKGGSFKSAYKAKCPIVPVALVDCYVPFDVPSIKRVGVKVIYLPPICYDEYKEIKTTELADMIQKKIQSTINEYADKTRDIENETKTNKKI